MPFDESPASATPNTPLPLVAFDCPWTPAVEGPAPACSTKPTRARATALSSVVQIVDAALVVFTAPSTTSAAAAGLGGTRAWAASAPPVAAAATSRERRERGAGEACGCASSPVTRGFLGFTTCLLFGCPTGDDYAQPMGW